MRYICEFCDKEFKSLRSLNYHNTIKHKKELEFKIEYCNICNSSNKQQLFEENNQLIWKKIRLCSNKKCICNTLNPVSLEFLIKVRGLSKEEAELFLSKKAKKGFVTARSNNPDYLKGENNPGSKKRTTVEKLKEKGLKVSKTRIEKELAKGDKNPGSKIFLINKGFTAEEAEIKHKNRNHFCEEFYTSRGFSKEESEKLRKIASSFSLENCILKYGEIKGVKKYNDISFKSTREYRINQLIKTGFCIDDAIDIYNKKYIRPNNSFGKASKESLKYFIPIYKFLRKKGYNKNDMFWGISGSKEWFIYNDKQIRFYDFFIKPLNLIIEFNGHHVHPYPKLSIQEQNNWKHAYNKKSFEEIKKEDDFKEKLAIDNNYVIIYLWSNITYEENLNYALETIRRLEFN